MRRRKSGPGLALSGLAILIAIGAFTGVAPAVASPTPTPASAAADPGSEISPLCQLEGGQAFAVDTGEGRQFPYDPLVYPFLTAGDRAQIKVIPCWPNDSAPTDNWITSVTASLGDDHAQVSQQDGLHTVTPFTLDLNGSGSAPSAVSIAQLTIRATDNQGVERWSAVIGVQLLTPCANNDVVGVDSGIVHHGYVPQLEGAAARISLIPCSPDTSTPPDTWITSVTAWVWSLDPVNDAHPAAEVSGLHATDPFTLDLHNVDGSPYRPGLMTLSLDVTDNHGVVQTVRRDIYIRNPVTASWSVGTTLPDTPTTVRASFDNESGSPIRSVTFRLANVVLGDPTPADLAVDGSYAESPMTFPAGGNRIWALVTLANGITYPLAAHEVISRYVVDTSVGAPQDTEWGDLTTFHANAISSAGAAQRGMTLHLQSRAPGSTTWVDRAAATTDSRGAATLTVPAARTGTAAWRVTSAQTKRQERSTSRTKLVRVHAVFGRLPANRSTRVRHVVRYLVTIRPANARARVDAQVQRVGHRGWTTVGHATSRATTTTIAVRPLRAGRYRVRLVVHATTVLAQTSSRSWGLDVRS